MSGSLVTPSLIFGAALDPVLLGVAAYLGWRADQAGKVFIATIAALGAALVVDAIITWAGLPWFAPVARSGPLLVPVRAFAALTVATLAFAAGRLVRNR